MALSWYSIIAFSCRPSAYAASGLTILIHGKKETSDISARIENGTILVPLRVIAENLDQNVQWDPKTNTVTIEEKVKQSGIERMIVQRDKDIFITYNPESSDNDFTADQARLFLQFFSKVVLERNLQEISKSYMADLHGIAKIFDYGNMMGHMSVEDSQSAAYGLLAMVVGLSFFRVANIPPINGEDNRYICEDYVRRFTEG